jgi:hypothetical protein
MADGGRVVRYRPSAIRDPAAAAIPNRQHIGDLMDFLHLWFTGLLHPSRAMDVLKARPAPAWGGTAVVVRFVGTSLLVTLPLALLGRTPFTSSYIKFIHDASYYRVWLFLLPLFGLFTWLLMSAVAQLLLRLSCHHTDFDQIANVTGMSMLIPMPVVWAWDLTMIMTGGYGLVVMAISHTIVQAWETVLGVIGLRRVLGLGIRAAILVAVTINLIYVLMGALFAR